MKNNSMEFLYGQITRMIKAIYESRMKWIWHHSNLVAEEVSCDRTPKVVLLQPYTYKR